MLRVDGKRGALCSMLSQTPNSIEELTRKLKRLECWFAYFGLISHIPLIQNWIEAGPGSVPLIIQAKAY